MATMTFLSTFNGSLGFQNTSGSGTFTATNSPTYSAGFWTGNTGVNITGPVPSIRTALTTASADPAQGSAVVRFRRNTDSGVIEYILTLGEVNAASSFLGVRVFTDDNLNLYHRGVSDTDHTLANGAVATGQDLFLYLEWDADSVGMALGTDALTETARTGSSQAWSAGAEIGVGYWKGNINTQLPGRVDGVAIFDAPLTTDERSYMRMYDQPWTWQMTMSAPITAYVDTVPSNGTRSDAPVLILP